MASCKTVTVIRKDHPTGYCVINEADMKGDDVLFGVKEVAKPRPVKKAAKRAAK